MSTGGCAHLARHLFRMYVRLVRQPPPMVIGYRSRWTSSDFSLCSRTIMNAKAKDIVLTEVWIPHRLQHKGLWEGVRWVLVCLYAIRKISTINLITHTYTHTYRINEKVRAFRKSFIRYKKKERKNYCASKGEFFLPSIQVWKLLLEKSKQPSFMCHCTFWK